MVIDPDIIDSTIKPITSGAMAGIAQKDGSAGRVHRATTGRTRETFLELAIDIETYLLDSRSSIVGDGNMMPLTVIERRLRYSITALNLESESPLRSIGSTRIQAKGVSFGRVIGSPTNYDRIVGRCGFSLNPDGDATRRWAQDTDVIGLNSISVGRIKKGTCCVPRNGSQVSGQPACPDKRAICVG